MQEIRKALFKVNPMRHMPEPSAGIHLLSEARSRVFGQERGIALLIVGGGALIGALIAFGLNTWLMRHYEMTRLPPVYVAIGVVTMLVLGQAAVLVPARRASNVPPIVATRSA
jgi:putative ABC transport system permease protein